MGESLSYRRIRAPRDHGGTLIDPPLADAPRVLADNVALEQTYNYDLQGRSMRDLASAARTDLLADAAGYTARYRDVDSPRLPAGAPPRIMLSGHQPELFHAGVWFKNFVLSSLAEQAGAVGIHLLIDNDVAMPVSIRVPGGSLSRPTVEPVPIDRPTAETAYEERGIIDRELFASFADRVAGRIEPFIANPLLSRLWPLAEQAAQRTGNLGRSPGRSPALSGRRIGAQQFGIAAQPGCEPARVLLVRGSSAGAASALPRDLQFGAF